MRKTYISIEICAKYKFQHSLISADVCDFKKVLLVHHIFEDNVNVIASFPSASVIEILAVCSQQQSEDISR